MNINDVEVPVFTGENMLADIFERQRGLMDKYKDIEAANGFHVPELPLNIDDRHAQAHLKQTAWRVAEELGEAYEALVQGDMEHYIEELSDALHFEVELCIFAGLQVIDKSFGLDTLIDTSARLVSGDADRRTIMLKVLTDLGMAMNCLKNKPWKSSHMLTDIPKFQNLVAISLARLVQLMAIDLQMEEIWQVYVRKNAVNKFRQRSNY